MLKRISRLALLCCALSSFLAVSAGAQTVSGTVFRDYNADGVQAAHDVGVGGVTVTAFDATGAAVGTTATLADGTYLAALAVGAGTAVRVELTGIPATLRPGPFGAASGTTVLFAQSGDSGVDVGLADPFEHCEDDPPLATSCYVNGDQSVNTDDVLVSFPYTAGNAGNSLPPGVDSPPHTVLATAQQIGPTWGLAYQKQSDSLFAAAFMKRHVSFGPGGTGAIYRIDVASATPSLFLDLNALFGAGTAGVDPHPEPLGLNDSAAWDPVGKIGLGDLDISDDGLTLWTINLADRRLYEIPIGSPPVAPAAGAITRTLLPLPGDCPAVNDVRPFATAFHNGLVYVGLVCSAESTGLTTDLRGYVYSWNGAVFTQVLNFPLNYARGCAVNDTLNICPNPPPDCTLGNWQAWIPMFGVIPSGFTCPPQNEYIYPQPWLSDIEFAGGNLLLGLRDRYGDQMGFQQVSTNPADMALYKGDSAGDILCASPAGPVFTMEANGSCGSLASAGGVGNGEGPGGGEFFYRDDYPLHAELSMGGLGQVAGLPDVAFTMYDPVFDIAEFYDGGTLWLSNTDGSRSRAYRIYDSSDVNPLPPGTDPGTFGKGGGLGDLEAMCEIAPVEIGNRVWMDDGDGIQDPGETPIAGATVSLVCTGGAMGTTVTDGAGQYLFNAGNVAGGLPPGDTCTIRLDNPADYAPAGPLEGKTLTLADQGSDLHDNDAVDAGVPLFPQISVVVGSPGVNDHTYDFGLIGVAPPAEDFGDAPDPAYPTLLASNGARHPVLPVGNPTLGATVDTEPDGQPDPNHLGDDNNGAPDDEDGVVISGVLVPGAASAMVVSTGATGGVLNAWCDWNLDGDWADAGEQIAADVAMGANAMLALNPVVPAGAGLGTTCCRYRLSSAGGLTPTGAAVDGEVEDHLATISVTPPAEDFGDAPDPAYPTLLASNGARHVVLPVNNPTLGAVVDTEPDGQPSATHAGDDNNGVPDDEDGVVIGSLVPGGVGSIDVTTGLVGGLLNAWCDWNADGDWADAGEQIATDQAVAGNAMVTLTPAVPAGAVAGTTCCRFRLSTVGGLVPTGPAADGEVEDHLATITPEAPLIGVAKQVLSVTPLPPDEHTVVFRITIQNFGNVTLDNIQTTVDLATAFAGAVGFMVGNVTSADFGLNPGFDGSVDFNLLGGADSLAPGASGAVDLEVVVEPGANLGPYFCSTTATGTSPLGTPVTDMSQEGTDEDPDGNGDPTDNDVPTRVVFLLPSVIPTLDVLGLGFLALLLGGAALVQLRRRRT